ncbi:YaiI/YqxD family protein [Carnobacterium mobile]|uniref:YaiI/YqxD family protein n=1 Tax=Carnobacterium mobile TaxID=2750 RepID=UPI00054E3301|nr:YaiI/YqxD family protein [Carnobacterium mobile]
MKIYIDADACPVKDIVISEGTAQHIPVILVTSISHFSTVEQPAGVETIYVDIGAEAADYRIMRLAKKGDLIVTQDYGLASLALAKGCIVLHHTGFKYTNDNIDQLLQSRYLSAQVRKSGKRTKGPKPFTEENRLTFQKLFKETLLEATNQTN